jgi:hypothetical protein
VKQKKKKRLAEEGGEWIDGEGFEYEPNEY